MKREEFTRKVRELVKEDSRYKVPAYHFVADAVSRTAKEVRHASTESGRHITGRELLEGIRRSALDKFGALALDVLEDWGVKRTEDFGHIVFRMVDKGLLGSSSRDTPADFANGYDFRETFLKPFMLGPDEKMPKLDPIDQ